MELLKIASQAWMSRAGALRRAGLFKALEADQAGMINPGVSRTAMKSVMNKVSPGAKAKYPEYIANKNTQLLNEAKFNDFNTRMRSTKERTDSPAVSALAIDQTKRPILNHAQEQDGIHRGNMALVQKHNIGVRVDPDARDMSAFAYVKRKQVVLPSIENYQKNYSNNDAKYRQTLSARHEINEIIDYNKGLDKDFAGHTHPSILVRDSALIAKAPNSMYADVSMMRHGDGEIRGLNSMHRRGGGGDFLFGESAKFNPKSIKAVDRGYGSYMSTRIREQNNRVDIFNALAKKHNDATDRIRTGQRDALEKRVAAVDNKYSPLIASANNKQMDANIADNEEAFHKYRGIKRYLSGRGDKKVDNLYSWDDTRNMNINSIIDKSKNTIQSRADAMNANKGGDSMFQSFKLGY